MARTPLAGKEGHKMGKMVRTPPVGKEGHKMVEQVRYEMVAPVEMQDCTLVKVKYMGAGMHPG
jgi:hypothetical protein